MPFARLTLESTDVILDFMRRHGDDIIRKRAEEPNAAAQLFRNRAIYGRHEEGRLKALVVLTERSHLTWDGVMCFPFVILPEPTPERKQAALAGLLSVWRVEAFPYWRRMVVYDDSPGGDEAPFLTAEGFRFVRRHVKHVREIGRAHV